MSKLIIICGRHIGKNTAEEIYERLTTLIEKNSQEKVLLT